MAHASAVPSAGHVAAALVLAFLVRAEARLGGGASADESLVERARAALLENAFPRGSAARGTAYWSNASLTPAASVDPASIQGYQYLATTTRYANTCCASCGSVDTAQVVQGSDYYAVASAQAMQDLFQDGSCCWCGEAGPRTGLASGVAPMGCGMCAKGRFIQKRPYEAPMPGSGALFQKEIKIVVADICPHQGNEAWCPAHVGDENQFGSKNHFDFAAPPPEFDNYYFAFTPEPCPAELQQKLISMSQCSFL